MLEQCLGVVPGSPVQLVAPRYLHTGLEVGEEGTVEAEEEVGAHATKADHQGTHEMEQEPSERVACKHIT